MHFGTDKNKIILARSSEEIIFCSALVFWKNVQYKNEVIVTKIGSVLKKKSKINLLFPEV